MADSEVSQNQIELEDKSGGIQSQNNSMAQIHKEENCDEIIADNWPKRNSL